MINQFFGVTLKTSKGQKSAFPHPYTIIAKALKDLKILINLNPKLVLLFIWYDRMKSQRNGVK